MYTRPYNWTFASGDSNQHPTQNERINNFNNFIPYAGDDDDSDTAMPDAAAPPPPTTTTIFPFLRLPRELRDHIYTYLAIAAGHYYATAGLLGACSPHRGGGHAAANDNDITAIPTLPSLISSRYLAGLLLASRQVRHEAIAAIYATPVGMAITSLPGHGDTIRSQRQQWTSSGRWRWRWRHNGQLQALSYTLPRTVLGLSLVRMQLQASGRAYIAAVTAATATAIIAAGAATVTATYCGRAGPDYWPRKLEHVVCCVCPRLRWLAVAVEGDGGCQWRALAWDEVDPENEKVFASAEGVWATEAWTAGEVVANGPYEGEEEDDDDYYAEFMDYRLQLSVTKRPRAADMLVRCPEIAGLLAWVPPVKSELREYSVVVRQNLGMPVLDVAGKVERRRVLGAPFKSERWSLDLTFWEVVWDWLVSVARDSVKKRWMIAELVERGSQYTSPLRQLPTAIAAELTIHAEAVYYAWVDAGKPSANRIDEYYLDVPIRGPLGGLFRLDLV